VVAFYTDIEHMVEPVTEGVRIILQFDVHVSKAEKEKKKKAADEDEEESEAQEGTVSRAVGVHCWKPDVPTSIPLSSAANDAIMDEIIAAIKNLHTDGVYEVGFPLQHLYRKASVLPAYLKCTDIRLYEALKQAFCVSLHPVLLEESSNYDGSWTIDRSGSDSGEEDYAGILAHKFDTPESESESDDNDPDSSDKRPKKKVKLQKVFYLPKMCPLVEIHSSEYVEYTGNEAQPAENKYFGAGFFVTAKKEENKNQ
jgi:hypothetical protein